MDNRQFWCFEFFVTLFYSGLKECWRGYGSLNDRQVSEVEVLNEFYCLHRLFAKTDEKLFQIVLHFTLKRTSLEALFRLLIGIIPI